MVEAIRRLRPRVVLLQHWEQRHPDHAAASRIVYDACFLAGLRNYRPDLGPAFRPTKLAYAVTMTEANDLAPTFVVDVTPVWETKMRAIAAFASQFTPAPGEIGLAAARPLPGGGRAVRPSPRPADRRALRRGLRDARAARESTTCCLWTVPRSRQAPRPTRGLWGAEPPISKNARNRRSRIPSYSPLMLDDRCSLAGHHARFRTMASATRRSRAIVVSPTSIT